jgi:hypothetical protein
MRALLLGNVAAGFVLITGSSSAQDTTFVGSEITPGFVRFAELIVSDQVDGRCWTNPSEVKAAARLIFEREDIAVLAERPAFYSPAAIQFQIGAVGYRQGNGVCATSVLVEAGRPVQEKWGGVNETATFYISWWAEIVQQHAIFSSGENNDQQISDYAEEVLTDFLADILSARRSNNIASFMHEFPHLIKPPMSASEFERRLNTTNAE